MLQNKIKILIGQEKFSAKSKYFKTAARLAVSRFYSARVKTELKVGPSETIQKGFLEPKFIQYTRYIVQKY